MRKGPRLLQFLENTAKIRSEAHVLVRVSTSLGSCQRMGLGLGKPGAEDGAADPAQGSCALRALRSPGWEPEGRFSKARRGPAPPTDGLLELLPGLETEAFPNS